MTSPAYRFIDPQVLTKISNLQLVAKNVVEGFIGGLHRAPYHGLSLDFVEYREYSQGDDVRSVDWKVYGRTDRFYVKKYEGETNTQVYILFDTSGVWTLAAELRPSSITHVTWLPAWPISQCVKEMRPG